MFLFKHHLTVFDMLHHLFLSKDHFLVWYYMNSPNYQLILQYLLIYHSSKFLLFFIFFYGVRLPHVWFHFLLTLYINSHIHLWLYTSHLFHFTTILLEFILRLSTSFCQCLTFYHLWTSLHKLSHLSIKIFPYLP